MARVLIWHSERSARKFLESKIGVHHVVKSVNKLTKAVKELAAFKPELILAELINKKPEAFELLRYLKHNKMKTPVLLTGAAGAGVMEPLAKKSGASGFLEYPMEQDTLDQAVSSTLQKSKDKLGHIPPISAEEKARNLTELEKEMNRHMECMAGKNQVYIQSLIVGAGKTSPPRIALKCPLRKQFGHQQDVYYEYIRDVCCKNPSACPAYQEFHNRK